MQKFLLSAVLLALAGCARAPVAGSRAGTEELHAERLGGGAVQLGGVGPVRLVELWATWCAPCAPASERARAVLARHPEVVAYAVSIDTDRAAVAAHAARWPPAGEVLVYTGGPGAAARDGFAQVPAFVVIDARGQRVGTVVGLTPNLGARLERLLRRAANAPGE